MQAFEIMNLAEPLACIAYALLVGINLAIKTNELFATFHMADIFLNCFTGTGTDSVVHMLEWKVVAVQVEKLATSIQR
jgi:hypothetical protein